MQLDSGAIVQPEESILEELEKDRPRRPVGMLSINERHRCVERGFVGLYRWYLDRSQKTRNWNPDTTFDWKNYGQNHSEDAHDIIEGFFAVEQYVPDYVTALLKVIRKSYGRSHFHLRWGSEEEKHSDMWRNAVLMGGRRSLEWVENYTEQLRDQEWKLPWEDPLHMLFYTVFQERATQINYVNLGLVAKGEHTYPSFANDADPVLAHLCRTIAIDEAAHYNFFLEGARLFMYYFPDESIQAMVDVIRHFSMPAREIIPNYIEFSETLHRTSIFGMRQHSRDVVKVALEQLGADNVRAVEAGIRRSREVPKINGDIQQTSIFESLDFDFVEKKVSRLLGKISQFEYEAGLKKSPESDFQLNPDLQAFRDLRDRK